MRLLYSKLNINIELSDEKPVTLVLESPHIMAEFIQKLLQMENGEADELILSDGEDILAISKNVFLEINPFECALNNRKVLTRLYKNMCSVGAEFYEERTEVQKSTIRYLDLILNAIRFDDLTYDFDFKDEDLFKLFNVQINEEYTLLRDKLLSVIRVCADLLYIPVVAFVNLGLYLTTEELRDLTEYAAGHKIYLLLIEGIEPLDRYGDWRYIIDRDLCLIKKS